MLGTGREVGGGGAVSGSPSLKKKKQNQSIKSKKILRVLNYILSLDVAYAPRYPPIGWVDHELCLGLMIDTRNMACPDPGGGGGYSDIFIHT